MEKNVESYSSIRHRRPLLEKQAAWSTQTALELKDTSVLHRLRKAPPLLESVGASADSETQ